MEYAQGTLGRAFVARLHDGERLPEALEAFAREQQIREALVIFLGGAQSGSRLVVGPDAHRPDAIVPLIHSLAGIQEVVGVGTLFPNEAGEPVLHLHAACGREGGATVGCTRAGVEVWLVGEVVILELLGIGGLRRPEPPAVFSSCAWKSEADPEAEGGGTLDALPSPPYVLWESGGSRQFGSAPGFPRRGGSVLQQEEPRWHSG